MDFQLNLKPCRCKKFEVRLEQDLGGRAVSDSTDDFARSQMLLASTYAGIGFGNAGVHLPHGMSYPVAGMVKAFVPNGFPRPEADTEPIIPHGMSVILNAPAVFRFTATANPNLHLLAASLMGVNIQEVPIDQAGQVLAEAIVKLINCPCIESSRSYQSWTAESIH